MVAGALTLIWASRRWGHARWDVGRSVHRPAYCYTRPRLRADWRSFAKSLSRQLNCKRSKYLLGVSRSSGWGADYGHLHGPNQNAVITNVRER